jgi:UrcA family protein
MHHPIRTTALLLCASVALTTISFAASAQTRSIRVHSFDIDLTTTAGQTELQQRIHHAVDQVCGPSTGANMDNIAAYASCSKAASASAMVQYDAMVKASHDGKLASRQTRDVAVR